MGHRALVAKQGIRFQSERLLVTICAELTSKSLSTIYMLSAESKRMILY